MRDQLAAKHIRGSGIEIGGRHFPLPVTAGAQVTYVDHVEDPESKVKAVIDDAERLDHFSNDSLDFIIANHVLEHCHDPIGTLKTWARRLKDGGIAFVALPDKDLTFDKSREPTTLQHMIDDHEYGSERGDVVHYASWHAHIDKLRGKELEERVRIDIESRANIHFHPMDRWVMQALFEYVKSFEILECPQNGAEIIWILKKK